MKRPLFVSRLRHPQLARVLGKNIAAARDRKGIDQVGLAERLGVGRTTVYGWEIGFSIPSLDRLPDIARELDTTISDLLRGTKAS